MKNTVTTDSSNKNPDVHKTPPSSFVKLAMRNMVRKGKQSLLHFGFTAAGFVIFIVAVAWLGRPNLPH